MPKYSKRRVDRICKLIEEDDYTVPELCKHAGISEATYYQWKLDKPEFLEAIKASEEKRLEIHKSAAKRGLLTLLQGKEYEETSIEYIEGKDGKPKIKNQKRVKKVILPNPTSVIFALKNLDPDHFQDLIKQEHSGSLDFKNFLMRNNTVENDGD